MRNRISLIVLFLSASVIAPQAPAVERGLADPTRPSGYSESSAAPASPSASLTLTLVRLGAKPQAVISGETVVPGETIAGYRLLSLHPSSAVLSGPNGRTVLQLTSTVRKSSSTPFKSSSTHRMQNR